MTVLSPSSRQDFRGDQRPIRLPHDDPHMPEFAQIGFGNRLALITVGPDLAGGNRTLLMKLAAKLIAVTIMAVLAVFAVRGYQNARRQMAMAESDARENAWLVGRALRPALVEVWRRDGEQRALEVLSYARQRVHMSSRWDLRFIPAPNLGRSDGKPLAPPSQLANLWRGDEITLVVPASGADQLVTYLPIAVEGRQVGALEIAGPLTARDERFKTEISQIAQRTAIGALVAILSIAVVGFMYVGRPMRRLVEKARRIGMGDLSGPLDLYQHDEIGVLAREMNDMCERLQAAQKRVADETESRIAVGEQLRHADRLTTVGKLASGVAHELGTPLNVVSGRAKMIVRGQVKGQDVLDSAQTIVEQSERMTRIIKQLLGFARRRQPQRKQESLRAIAERILILLHPMARKTGVTFAALDRDPDPVVEVDASLIEQALTNLVVNAIQAMPTGGTIRVGLTVDTVTPPADLSQASAEYAGVHVEDQGAGITPEHLAHIFEPFFTTKDVGEGTGLGLSVAYGIVRDHGGWIDAASEINKGSHFSIYLPITAQAPVTPNDDKPAHS
jgi:two-component system, NtrC family, sensor kinase